MRSMIKKGIISLALAVSLPVAANNYTIGTGSQSVLTIPWVAC